MGGAAERETEEQARNAAGGGGREKRTFGEPRRATTRSQNESRAAEWSEDPGDSCAEGREGAKGSGVAGLAAGSTSEEWWGGEEGRPGACGAPRLQEVVLPQGVEHGGHVGAGYRPCGGGEPPSVMPCTRTESMAEAQATDVAASEIKDNLVCGRAVRVGPWAMREARSPFVCTFDAQSVQQRSQKQRPRVLVVEIERGHASQPAGAACTTD